MKTLIDVFILFLLTNVSILSEVEGAEYSPDTRLFALTKSCTQSVKCDPRVTYILGTYHEGVSLSELPAGVRKKIVTSEFLAVEHAVDTKVISNLPESLLIEAVNHLNFNGEELTAQERSKLRDEWNVPKDLTARATSSDCGLLLFADPILQKALDLEVQAAFHKEHPNAPIVSLESREDRAASEQKSKLGKRPACDIRKYLATGKLPIINARKEGGKRYLEGMGSGLPDDWAAYVGIRNQIWVPKIIALREKGSTFVAVGFAHIYEGGANSLDNIFKAQGYHLTPIYFATQYW